MDGLPSGEANNLKGRLKDLVNVAQLRVILTTRADQPALYDSGSHLCYHVMGLVHKVWAPVPGGIKDYIATPKSNGYRVRLPFLQAAIISSPSLHRSAA